MKIREIDSPIRRILSQNLLKKNMDTQIIIVIENKAMLAPKRCLFRLLRKYSHNNNMMMQ
jgi:hypothetical protein